MDSDDNQKMGRGRRRSAYIHEGQKKWSSKKWFRHHPHERLNIKSNRINGREVIVPTELFPPPEGLIDVLVAVMRQEQNTVKEYMQSGASSLRKNGCYCTLLQMLSEKNLPEMVKLLLDQKVDINAVNRCHQTAAHLFALEGKTEMLRVLLADKNFNPNIKDNWCNTYKELMSIPLYSSVLWSDTKHIEKLLELGANPDGYVGKFSRGVLARELGVRTPRELAISLKMDAIIQKFKENDSLQLLKATQITPKMSPLDLQTPYTTRKGHVTVFNYKSFKGLPGLTYDAAEKDANNLGEGFSQKGFNGEIHISRTAEETVQVLKEIREMEMLKDVEILIFYFSSYDTNRHDLEESFLASDKKVLRVNSILNLFKESHCPSYLKNKPKIFIFDLIKHPSFRADHGLEYPDVMKDEGQMYYSTRSQGLAQTICYYSSTEKVDHLDFTKTGSYLNKAICRFLYLQQNNAFSLCDLFQDVKQQMSKIKCPSNSYYISTEDNWSERVYF